MICPDCHGTGWPKMLPPIGCCETCNGSGIAYCCEGERLPRLERVSFPYYWSDPEEIKT